MEAYPQRNVDCNYEWRECFCRLPPGVTDNCVTGLGSSYYCYQVHHNKNVSYLYFWAVAGDQEFRRWSNVYQLAQQGFTAWPEFKQRWPKKIGANIIAMECV